MKVRIKNFKEVQNVLIENLFRDLVAAQSTQSKKAQNDSKNSNSTFTKTVQHFPNQNANQKLKPLVGNSMGKKYSFSCMPQNLHSPKTPKSAIDIDSSRDANSLFSITKNSSSCSKTLRQFLSEKTLDLKDKILFIALEL